MDRYYIQPLRRGWKVINENGITIRDDWADYEKDPAHIAPTEGELVAEYYNGIPRFKFGDGVNEFSALPYISADSFVLPKQVSVTIKAVSWTQAADDRWYQVVTVDNAAITSNSVVTLYPSAEQLAVFHNKNLEFVAENNDGIISIFCVGAVPDGDYTILATITEVMSTE